MQAKILKFQTPVKGIYTSKINATIKQTNIKGETIANTYLVKTQEDAR